MEWRISRKYRPDISHCFRLEQTYGAIAFYLANRSMVDEYLKEGDAEFQQLQQILLEKRIRFYQKLKAAQVQKQVNV